MLQKAALIIVVFATLVAVPLSASEIIDLGPRTTAITMEEVDRGENVIQVTISEVTLDVVDIEGGRWVAPRVPTGSNLMERGLPSLPFVTSHYLLGRTDGLALRLIDVQTVDVDLGLRGFEGVAPSRGHFTRDMDPEDIPWVFDSGVYEDGKPYPGTDVWLDGPAIAGPWRFESFRIPVASWDSTDNVLTVVERATFEITAVDEAANPRLGPDRPRTALFGSLQDAVNAPDSTARSVTPGRLLILAYDDFIDEIQPLADWETLVGYPTLVTALSTVPHGGANPTAAEIKDYIQSLYDSPEGLAWIILVGDYQQIPNLNGDEEGASCDPCYTKLEGADDRPDASISRISAQNGADVTVQVNKILHYEQEPDTGSAAAWYTSAFGIGGNDTGGTGLADWERVDLLRADLMTPNYHYTEFDQLYHSPNSNDVKVSVEGGTSLGLYIGHGADTYWVTSGFSVSDVHNLVNGEMLPVVWDVACVNGAFHNNNECFAESWLRRDGGGAVSFEAATTNESWVPPCDAQRGFIDALRLETDFTTGAQHIAGKLICMDLWPVDQYGNDEGLKFMEQSHLFGSAVLWPRTTEPSLIDPPLDFAMAGGTASLTVKVDGSPLAIAGAAIVNFYTADGDAINPVGSGLIDENGVVEATVTTDPTHCHIHGYNLIPQSFELTAQDDGRITLSGTVFACSDSVTVRVADANVPGTSPVVADTMNVDVDAGGAPISVLLTETDVDSGFFEGSFVLGSDLVVAHGDVVTAVYDDADTGSGPQTKTATASVDCAGPVITNVESSADHESLTISFSTSEPGNSIVRWGLTTPPTNFLTDASLLDGTHTVTIEGLDPCQMIYFEVGSTDAVGNTTVDDNGGAWYSAMTQGWTVYFEATMDTDPGWAVDNGGNGHGWAFGTPTGGGGAYGNPDPSSGATGSNVYGVNLDGDYDNNLGDNQLKLTTPAIDLSGSGAIQLSFQQYLNVEQPTYDHARVQVSTDGGGSWTTVWENSDYVEDSAWSEHVIDLTALAADQADVRIRWTQGATDSGWTYSGWNIDDVRIEGSADCLNANPVFSDGFENGDTGAWSAVAEGS